MSNNKNNRKTINASSFNFKKKRTLFIIISVVFILIACLYFFPVYRIAKLSYAFDYFSKDEIRMLAYRGSFGDRSKAHKVIEAASAAFEDCGHTIEENEEAYGVLSVYATSVEQFKEAKRSTHSIVLWSAHFDDTKGYMWVCITQTVYDCNNNVIYEISKQPSLWTVEKTDSDNWIVIETNTHP